jgi:CBS domain-containing protein
MKVSDILRVKGHSLITVTPDETLATAIQIMFLGGHGARRSGGHAHIS